MQEDRKTHIVEEEIEEENHEETQRELKRDALFENIKQVLIQEHQLLEKFHHYCDQYIEYELDVQGLSDEEANDTLRKIKLLEKKIVTALEENISYKIENTPVAINKFQIKLNCKEQEENFEVIIESFGDSFNLEIL